MRIAYARGECPIELPQDASEGLRELTRKSSTNFLPMLLDAHVRVLKVNGYLSKSDPGKSSPWVWWQRNRMDARQTTPHRNALKYGFSYATVLPANWGLSGASMPDIQTYSPRELSAVYNFRDDEWPAYALLTRAESAVLFDGEMLYFFGVERPLKPWMVPAASTSYGMGEMVFLEARPHGFHNTPVIRFRDRYVDEASESHGVIEPLIHNQQRLDEMIAGMTITAKASAHRQRAVLGWVPQSEDEEIRSHPGSVIYLKGDIDPETGKPQPVDIKDLSETPLTSWDAAIRETKQDLFARAAVPITAAGVDGVSNVSAETLAALETEKARADIEHKASLGESHEQLFRACAFYDGNMIAAEDYASEARWEDFRPVSYTAVVDGISKLIPAGLPKEVAFSMLPGMTDQQLERINEAVRAQNAREALDRLTNAANRGAVQPTD